MRLGDALHDRQAEADARVIGAYALAAALKRLRECGNQLRVEPLAGVLDGEHRALGLNARRHPHRALLGEVVDDRVVHEIRRQLQQERARADGRARVARGLDREAPFFC